MSPVATFRRVGYKDVLTLCMCHLKTHRTYCQTVLLCEKWRVVEKVHDDSLDCCSLVFLYAVGKNCNGDSVSYRNFLTFVALDRSYSAAV